MSRRAAPDSFALVRRLEDIIGHDPGARRGIAPLISATRGSLHAAAQSLRQHPQPDIRIMTGFFLAHGDPPACETDGPPGAVHLAAGFDRLGIPCRLTTDAPNAAAVRAAAAAALRADFPIEVAAVPDYPEGEELSVLSASWRAQPPSHVISIERCGPAHDGIARNSRGAEMTAHNAPLEQLYMAGDWTRIAIGDGGNEIGMGALPRDLVTENIPRGLEIASTVPCDHLIVSGVSNWGAMALLCALGLIHPEAAADLTASLTPEIDRRILTQMVANGPAVAIQEWGADAAPRPTLAVDGLPWEYHAEIMRKLTDILP